jgi:hypothetical protein
MHRKSIRSALAGRPRRPMRLTQRCLSVAGLVALLTAVTAGSTALAAGPAPAPASAKLASATVPGWGLYVSSPTAVDVTNVAGKIQTWNVVDQGHGTWGGVTGESYEFQQPGTNLCLTWAHNILFAGDPTYLTTCLSNGTSWVDSAKRLFSRYELTQSTPVKAVLVMSAKPTAGSAATVIQTSKLGHGVWAPHWKGF